MVLSMGMQQQERGGRSTYHNVIKRFLPPTAVCHLAVLLEFPRAQSRQWSHGFYLVRLGGSFNRRDLVNTPHTPHGEGRMPSQLRHLLIVGRETSLGRHRGLSRGRLRHGVVLSTSKKSVFPEKQQIQ